MNLLILGFIRPELDYESVEALVVDIELDIDVARTSLERETYKIFAEEPWLVDFDCDRKRAGGKAQGESGGV